MRAYGLKLVCLSIVALTPAPVFAQAADSAKPAVSAKKLDLNEIVCEKQKIPGSRLASAKVCKTRAEWADLRHQDRMDLERAQTQRSAGDK